MQIAELEFIEKIMVRINCVGPSNNTSRTQGGFDKLSHEHFFALKISDFNAFGKLCSIARLGLNRHFHSNSFHCSKSEGGQLF